MQIVQRCACIEWLKIPDVPRPGVTGRSSYDQLRQGVNGRMAANDCLTLATTLPYVGLFTMIGSAILNKATYLFFTNSKTIHHGYYPGSVLVDLVESSNYIAFLHVHFYLFPTRLADEERLRSAVRDLVRNIRAQAGDGWRVAWFFSHDHSPPKDYKFLFCYFISNNRETDENFQDDRVKWRLRQSAHLKSCAP